MSKMTYITTFPTKQNKIAIFYELFHLTRIYSPNSELNDQHYNENIFENTIKSSFNKSPLRCFGCWTCPGS